jgi:hypothetical protein
MKTTTPKGVTTEGRAWLNLIEAILVPDPL